MTADVLETLNHLAEISRDGARGFQEAASAIEAPDLKATLQRCSERCEAGAKELDVEVVKLGGSPTDSGSMTGALHRAWTNLKAVVTNGDPKAILEECERGEDAAESAYANALEDEYAPGIVAILQRQYAGVRENHAMIKQLRDAA
jgi:uncharacterized protein (TIGR02284 family)